MKKSLFASFALSLSSSVAFAWGDTGHMTVCQLAMLQTTPTARAAIMKITNNGSFPLQCIWPDQVKRLGAWRSTAGYHFINYEDGAHWMPTDKAKNKDGQLVSYSNAGDMLQMLERAKDKLSDPSTNANQKLCYLRYLGHLAGDSHQPLHAGRGTDFGGNNIKVTFNGDPLYRLRIFALNIQTDPTGNIVDSECAKQIFTPSLSCMASQTILEKKPDGTMGPLANNLHMMWDDVFIDTRLKEIKAFPPDKFDTRDSLESAKALIADMSPTFMQRAADLKSQMADDPLKWVEITNQRRDFAYDTTGIEDANAYYHSRYPVVADQIIRAGYHLAGTLNILFDPAFRVNPYISVYLTKRKAEIDARIKAGRTTEFKTACDDIQ